MEKIAIKSRTTQAKVWGSIISISGAFIVTFYKGKSIIIAHNSSFFHLQQPNHILTSVDTNWAIGGLLLTVSNILLTIWFVAQVHFLFANIEIYNRYFTLKICLVSDISVRLTLIQYMLFLKLLSVSCSMSASMSQLHRIRLDSN